jgi:hypothetical protein
MLEELRAVLIRKPLVEVVSETSRQSEDCLICTASFLKRGPSNDKRCVPLWITLGSGSMKRALK